MSLWGARYGIEEIGRSSTGTGSWRSWRPGSKMRLAVEGAWF
jgi:hypothetical protein